MVYRPQAGDLSVGRIVTTKRCTITEKMVARDRHRPVDAGGVE